MEGFPGEEVEASAGYREGGPHEQFQLVIRPLPGGEKGESHPNGHQGHDLPNRDARQQGMSGVSPISLSNLTVRRDKRIFCQ